MDELKVSRQKVLDAAEKCPTFKNVAKELWPEVFETEITADKFGWCEPWGYPMMRINKCCFLFKIKNGIMSTVVDVCSGCKQLLKNRFDIAGRIVVEE